MTDAWDDTRPARARPDRRLRALRLLPADVPDATLSSSEEMDSPRGRIVLMRVGHEEGEPMLAARWSTHFDRCLGCMACVTACPSGVQYDKLIEARAAAGRAQLRRARARERAVPAGDLRAVHPPRPAARARAGAGAAAAARRSTTRSASSPIPQLQRAARARARRAARAPRSAQLPEVDARRAASRAAASRFMQGCVQRVFFGDVNAATVARAGRRGLRGARAARSRAAAARCSCTRASRTRRAALAQARRSRPTRASTPSSSTSPAAARR